MSPEDLQAQVQWAAAHGAQRRRAALDVLAAIRTLRRQGRQSARHRAWAGRAGYGAPLQAGSVNRSERVGLCTAKEICCDTTDTHTSRAVSLTVHCSMHTRCKCLCVFLEQPQNAAGARFSKRLYPPPPPHSPVNTQETDSTVQSSALPCTRVRRGCSRSGAGQRGTQRTHPLGCAARPSQQAGAHAAALQRPRRSAGVQGPEPGAAPVHTWGKG